MVVVVVGALHPPQARPGPGCFAKRVEKQFYDPRFFFVFSFYGDNSHTSPAAISNWAFKKENYCFWRCSSRVTKWILEDAERGPKWKKRERPEMWNECHRETGRKLSRLGRPDENEMLPPGNLRADPYTLERRSLSLMELSPYWTGFDS